MKKWANGDKYEGAWENDNFHGQGTFTWTDGDKFTGEFVKGQRNGHGRFVFASGKVREGMYVNNKYQSETLMLNASTHTPTSKE